MPLLINLQLLRQKPQRVAGEIPVAEITEDFHDELIQFVRPLRHDLEIRLEGAEIFLRGSLGTEVEYSCSRCLRTFRAPLDLPDYAGLAPMAGEESVPIVGDFANLTPLLREDTLLALPTAPLCEPDCRGLAVKAPARDLRSRDQDTISSASGKSPWDALERLKL